jgi:hypothetical protein
MPMVPDSKIDHSPKKEELYNFIPRGFMPSSHHFGYPKPLVPRPKSEMPTGLPPVYPRRDHSISKVPESILKIHPLEIYEKSTFFNKKSQPEIIIENSSPEKT